MTAKELLDVIDEFMCDGSVTHDERERAIEDARDSLDLRARGRFYDFIDMASGPHEQK